MHNAPHARLSEGLGFANQYSYAWQVVDTQAGGLYFEIPFNFAGYTSANTRDGVARGGTNSYLFTPGLRFKFSLHSRLSLYDNGNPVNMPFTNPDGSVSRFAAVNFSLNGNTSQKLVVANVDNNVNYAWAYLSFPGSTAPIAGKAVVLIVKNPVTEESGAFFRVERWQISLLPRRRGIVLHDSCRDGTWGTAYFIYTIWD